MNKVFDRVVMSAMTILLIALLAYIVILVYPFKVVEYRGPYKVETPIVKAGENLRYKRNFTKLISAQGLLHCTLQNGIIYALPDKQSNWPVGEYHDSIEITIPQTIPPSKYQYHCTVTFVLFGFRNVRHEFITEEFLVVK